MRVAGAFEESIDSAKSSPMWPALEADAIAASLPQAQRLTVEGQEHVVAPKARSGARGSSGNETLRLDDVASDGPL
jgi:hypothetical protein